MLRPLCRIGGRFAFLVAILVCAANGAFAWHGTVIDDTTGNAIASAIVTLDQRSAVSDGTGAFELEGTGGMLRLRATGYRRLEIPAFKPDENATFRLARFTPKALYLSFYGVGSQTLRAAALALIRQTELNAVVVDIKGDRGLVAYPSAVPLATEIGARRITTIPDLPAFVKGLHQQNVYAIARIVVFKDEPLAVARPAFAVMRDDGTIFRDREKLAWIDPFQREAWDYTIQLAVEAAAAGFDEIQFDYVRFPDDAHIRLSAPNTEDARVKAITGYLALARARLRPYNVFLAVDVFGYTCWNLDDTHIGQRLEDIAPIVDYISPMLYPSGFQFGIPGCENPVSHSYEIVRRSLDQARQRTGLPANRFRPWLQAFKDYAFDRRVFGADEVQAQIKAADEFGSDGWMLWNPRNVYQDLGLKP